MKPRRFRVVLSALMCLTAGCPSDSGSDGDEGSTGADGTTGPSSSAGMTTMPSDDTMMVTTMSTSVADTGTGGSTTDPDTGDSTAGDESSSSGGDTGPVVAPCPYDPVVAPSDFALEIVVDGLTAPMFVLGHPTEPDRLFVLERGGTIQMIEPGTTMPTGAPILSIGDVENSGESGLFGLAFHPDFPNDPRIYVNYVAPSPRRTKIVEYSLDPDAGYVVDATSARIILEIHQPAFNHNGGGIAFDNSGYLLIGMGDGGTSSTSQVNNILLAKFLRIGVEADGTPDNTPACGGCPTYGPFDYTIPPDNPFVGMPGYAPEIFALGFRNPWRWSIDVETDDIWVGDVGQNAYEEVDFVEAGRNYGWSDMEGFHCYAGACDAQTVPNGVNNDGLSLPVFEISQAQGDCSVIGGAVYRSCEVPEWDGTYLFADYCNADVRAFRFDGDSVDSLGVVFEPNNGLVGNGWNAWGDVFFTGGSVTGRVYRVVPVP